MARWEPSMQELKQFTLNNVNNRLGHDVQEKVLPQYDSWGGCEGIAAKLGASLNAGIQASEVGARKEQYGINYIEPDPPTPFWRFCLDALEDFTLRLLLFFAAMSTIIGLSIEHERKCFGYIDGLAIFATVFFVVMVAAIQEQDKENKFRALSANASEEQVNVIRDGAQQLISVKEVVVGDTIVLSTGDILCADGLVYERNNLSIFEGPLTGESHPISKGKYEFKEAGSWEMPPDEDLKQIFPPGMSLTDMKAKFQPTPNKTPLVFAGTQVQDGEGKMVVIAVGENTYQETLLSDKKEQAGDDDDDDDEEEGKR